MGKFKIWEALLFAAVILLAVIAYEAHKANINAPGRYESAANDSGPDFLLDTVTGKAWYYDGKKWLLDQPAVPK